MSDWPFVDYQYPQTPDGGCRLALVGEAPGAEEVRLGYPFAGRSGKLLDDTLRRAGIDRGTCLVANVFRRRPPDNKVGDFFASRARARRESLSLCERYGQFDGGGLCLDAFAPDLDHLTETLARLRPAVAVALGRTPFWALTGHGRGLLAQRGRAMPCRLVAGLLVMPTFHPSYLLRGRHQEVEVFLQDLRSAAALAGG